MKTCTDCRAAKWSTRSVSEGTVVLCPLHAAAQDMLSMLVADATERGIDLAGLKSARALLQSLPGALPSGVAPAAADKDCV